MNKNVRIAIKLAHKDDSISESAGSIAYSDYQWNDRRFLHLANGNNEWLLFKDENTDDIADLIKDIIQIGNTNDLIPEPCLTFVYQFDERGNATYSADVIDKWREHMDIKRDDIKPYVWNIFDGLRVQLIPIYHERLVISTVTLDSGVQYDDIGKATEALMNKFVNIENNLTFRVVKIYDKCMKIAHDLHLLDVNQDVRLTDLWGRIINYNGVMDEIWKWLPNVDMYQHPAVQRSIDLSTSDSSYLYKYVLTDTNNDNPIPVFNTVISCESTSPAVTGELLHTRRGILMNSFINKSNITNYIRRDMNPYSGWTSKVAAAFKSNPKVPTDHLSSLTGNNDNQINKISGNVKLDYRKDVADFAYRDMPWIQVIAECYNFNGTKLKTVYGIWEKNNSNKLNVDKSMLSGTFNFNINLNGYYAVKLLLRVFWGTFNSWTDEVEIAYFGLARGNNSGGTFDLNTYIFDGKKNRILTRYALIDASKYEKSTTINGVTYGWSANFNPPITYNTKAKFSVPGSANYHYTRWYGKFINADEPVQRVEYNNLGRTKVVDMSGSMHYYRTAQNYSLLTSVTLNATMSGLKANYVSDTYNTPFIYPPITKDCTIMLRGGSRYLVTSHCKNLKMTQTGVYKVEVGTIRSGFLNSIFYGNDVVMSQDMIIHGKSGVGYKFDIFGNEPKISKLASSVPNPKYSRNSNAILTIDGLEDKPENETGIGYMTIVDLAREYRLEETSHNVIELVTDDGSIESRIPFNETETWKNFYNSYDGKQRGYFVVRGRYLYIMTYYINVKKVIVKNVQGNTLELLLRDGSTNDVVTAFPLLTEKPANSVTIEFRNSKYYIELSNENDSNRTSVVLSDINGHNTMFLK